MEITIVYLFLDSPDTCVERVEERVQKGGHSVPEFDIRRRFLRSIRNFWQLYRPLADQWLLIYKSGNEPLDIAAGTAEDVSIRDAEHFARFTFWIEGDRHVCSPYFGVEITIRLHADRPIHPDARLPELQWRSLLGKDFHDKMIEFRKTNTFSTEAVFPITATK